MPEQRAIKSPSPITVRDNGSGGKILTGYGAVFYDPSNAGTEYQIWPGLVERLKPGCFNRALQEKQDVRGLYNHDRSWLLGRTKSATLALAIDAIGLRYDITLPDSDMAAHVAQLAARGDLDGSSFSFDPRKESYERGEAADIRWLEDVDLFDVGPVTFPAYEATTAALRSADGDRVKRQWESWRAAQQPANSDADAIAVRMALLGLD